jgi:hypothetical protein
VSAFDWLQLVLIGQEAAFVARTADRNLVAYSQADHHHHNQLRKDKKEAYRLTLRWQWGW